MEINKNEYLKIQNIFKNMNNKYEFEARILTNINFYKYENIMNKLIFSKNVGGYELKYTIDTTMDIKVDDYRVSIMGKDDVKKYWLSETLDANINHKFISKKTIERHDLEEYNIRINLAEEEQLNPKIIETVKNLISDQKKVKTYRIKN